MNGFIKAQLYLDRIMKRRKIGALELHHESGVAYNTALSYQRDASERISKDVLGKIASYLGVDVWELFLPEDDENAIISIAKSVGIENPEGVSASELIGAISEKISK